MQLELQRGKGKKLKKMTISEDVYDRWKDFCDKLGIYNRRGDRIFLSPNYLISLLGC